MEMFKRLKGERKRIPYVSFIGNKLCLQQEWKDDGDHTVNFLS